MNVVLLQRLLGLQTNDSLVKQYLIEYRAKGIAVALMGHCRLDSLRYGAAQRTASIGML